MAYSLEKKNREGPWPRQAGRLGCQLLATAWIPW